MIETIKDVDACIAAPHRAVQPMLRQPVPVAPVRKLVEARVKQNEAQRRA